MSMSQGLCYHSCYQCDNHHCLGSYLGFMQYIVLAWCSLESKSTVLRCEVMVLGCCAKDMEERYSLLLLIYTRNVSQFNNNLPLLYLILQSLIG